MASTKTHPETLSISETGRVPTVLVPLDGSTQAAAAWPVAMALGKLKAATLHIVHVAARAVPPQELLGQLKLPSEQVSGLVLDQCQGRPASEIVQQAKEWRSVCIVMCTHTGVERPRGTLGTVAREVLQAAPCPIVLVKPERGQASWKLRRILFPYDGTPTTAAAIGPAADLARQAGAELIVLHVAATDVARPKEPGAIVVPRYLDQPQHEWPVWAHEFLERLRALGHPPEDVAIRLFVGAGDIGRTIVELAAQHESDLIALAWRGMLEPEHTQIAQTVLSHAPYPLIIYRIEA